ETPTVTFGFSPMQMGTRNKASGALTMTYPLFSGFAISGSVEKARLNHEKAALQVADLKRRLYLQATYLYAAASASDGVIAALEEAKKAMDDSYRKARGLYENGLLSPSALYTIEAKGYAIDAELAETRNRKQSALNRLSYLAGEEVTCPILPLGALLPSSISEIRETALQRREDLMALAKAVGMARSDTVIARSRFYPAVVASAALKRQGDTLELNGDGYTNADQSYAGIGASWHLFDGFADRHTVQASKAAEMAAVAALEDYKHQISMEIDNTMLQIESLQIRLKSAQMEVRAASEYARLTQGRFENRLSSADELSRAIADLAASKSKAATIESELFTLNAALWLEGGLELYRHRFLPRRDVL
ncbi:MAG: TolC family protein, partial [Campylobacterales bacterium]|nr:TolC family protein [Campylobacterales bacterium]